MKKRKAKYKQMNIDTSIRNPKRCMSILNIVRKYVGMKLDDTTLLDIVCELYLTKVVKSKNYTFSNSDTKESIKENICQINQTRKADGGFPQGYQSRFWTYMRTLSELGLVYARYEEILEFSDITKSLVKKEINLQEAFSVQTTRCNRKSPYRNVKNDYNFFKFIFDVLKLKKKLTYSQFIIATYDKDGNVNNFIETIKNKNFVSSKCAYNYLKSIYNNINKERTVTKDYPDATIRILKLIGCITKDKDIIKLNDSNVEYFNTLFQIDSSLTEKEKIDAKDYYKKLSDENYNNIYLEIIKKHRE